MSAPSSVVFPESNLIVMPRYADHYFDLAWADVPFGINESKKCNSSRNTPVVQRSGNIIRPRQTKYKVSDWDNKPPGQLFYDELFRVAKGVIIKGENYISFAQKDSSSGRICWYKFNGDNDFSDAELMWTNLHKTVKFIPFMWNGMMQGKSLAEPHIAQPNKKLNEKRLQPGHTPVMFMQALFRDYAKEGFKILSTHTGSGSDRIAAYDMGCDFVGCENNIDNWNGQEKRFKDYIIEQEIFRRY